MNRKTEEGDNRIAAFIFIKHEYQQSYTAQEICCEKVLIGPKPDS